jgi:TP901 family phage tail tape measure protein
MRQNIKAGSAYVELLLKDGKFIGKLRSAGQKLKQFGSDMQAMGRTLAVASAAILVPMGYATKVFADFDDAMRAAKAVSQATTKEFAAMTAQAKMLGASTSFTAIQVAQLKTELGRAGFKPDQINDMTAAVLDLARATGTEAPMAAGIMAATIRQFGLEAKESTRVADALTVAANKSFNTVESLGESLSYAGPVAADLGMSLEETLAILGALGNVGIQGSNSGTALRRLGIISAAEGERLKEIFGTTFVDAAGNARRLVDALDDVARATNKMGNSERAAKFNEAFGLLGITGASAISKSVVSVRELENALYGAEGAAAKTAKEMDAGLGGSIRIMISAFEGLQIAIGETLAPALTAVADKLIGISDGLRDVTANNGGAVNSLASSTAVIGGYGAAFLGLGVAAKAAGWSMEAIAKVQAAIIRATKVARIGPYGVVLAGGVVASSILHASSASATARADKRAAEPLGDMSEVDKLKQRLEILSEQDVLDQEAFNQAQAAVKQLESEFGPLGIAIDQTAGTITGLEQAFAMIDATRVLKNAETQIVSLKEQVASIGEADSGKLAALEAKLKMYVRLAKEARVELDGVGSLTSSSFAAGSASGKPAGPKAADESKLQTLAKQIAEQIKSANRRDGAGTFGGQDLANRLSKSVTSIGQLQIQAVKENTAAVNRVVEQLRNNPGLVGA